MQFQGSVITEHGVTFGVVKVEEHVLKNSSAASYTLTFGRRAFGKMPIILMAQNSSGTPTYYGRRDIVGFLDNLDLSQIPFSEWDVS